MMAENKLTNSTNSTPQSKPTILKGVVVSNKMQKTLVVKVDRLVSHPKYKKKIIKQKKYKAHNEKGDFQVGDQVEIEESRPFSKEKKWKVK